MGQNGKACNCGAKSICAVGGVGILAACWRPAMQTRGTQPECTMRRVRSVANPSVGFEQYQQALSCWKADSGA
eukprot:12238130-Alexandrium_andersonii.AAC.1